MKAELRDFAVRDIGCIPCWIAGHEGVPCEKHHLLTTGLHGNGKRRGEQATIGCCPYHHRGQAAVGTITARMMRADYGPSYADEPEAFRATFGTDDDLLKLQDDLISAWLGSVV